MDVYIKCSSSADIISSTFGVTAYNSIYSLNNGKEFKQSANQASASSWLPVNNDGSVWDSFVTTGCRVQGSDTTLASGQAGFLGMQLDTNWASSSTGGQIVGSAGGAGWYPSIGASTTTNPYAKAGQYSGTGSVNTAKATSTIAGNGITAGQSLSNYWMIGRFSIEVTGDSATNNTVSLQFAVAGKNNGTTTFTGATQTAGRFSYTLTYAAVPAPGAAALVGLAGALSRRRRN
jgi:MYXO-CTERM domain-containing protein